MWFWLGLAGLTRNLYLIFLSNLVIKILNYSSIKFDIFVISFVT